MQQTGTLKKRKKRNLAKVAGLGTVPYSETDDNFDGRSLFNRPSDDVLRMETSFRTDADTRLRMSAYMHQRMGSSTSSGRVTRNPDFHRGGYDDEEDMLSDRGSRMFTPPPKERSEYIKDRHHLLDKATVNRLRMLLLLGGTSGAFPWYWDHQKFRIEKWTPFFEKLWKIQWFFVTIQTAFLTIFQIYSFIHRVSGQNKTYREVFMNSLSVYWYICAVYFNCNMYIYKDQIRQYINTMLAFNKSYVDKYLIHTEGYKDGGRILINLSIPSNCSQVFASVALFCVMPYQMHLLTPNIFMGPWGVKASESFIGINCLKLELSFQPWYLFSYIYPPKYWFWLIPGALQEFVVVGQVITSYMLTAWIVVAHTNSVEFWLRETHNHNDSDYTTDEIRHPSTALETYRALQILCTCFNDCMSPLAIPLVKIHILTGLIPCGYVLIRSMNHIFIEEFPGILTYPIGVIDCATAGFAMMTMAAEMFDLAVSFVDSWSRTKQKDFRRVLMSLPTLKVKVGRFYFLTVTSTITFFKTTFDYIIDCIITFP